MQLSMDNDIIRMKFTLNNSLICNKENWQFMNTTMNFQGFKNYVD